MNKWFLEDNDEVRGPFSTDQVQAQQSNGSLGSMSRVWGPGMTQWVPHLEWSQNLENLEQTQASIINKTWYYANEGQAHGPLEWPQLISQLQSLGDHVHNVLLWTKGMTTWTSLYEFYDVMDELEINRRQRPRAPIEGKVVIHLEHTKLMGLLKTISDGGWGAEKLEGLVPAQVVNAELHSQAFTNPLHVKAEVRYISDSGFIGFSFVSINRESASAIIQYVKNHTNGKASKKAS